MKKKPIKIVLLALLGTVLLYFTYITFLSPTRIALINFPAYQISNIKAANSDNIFIRIDEILPTDKAATLADYDAILLFGPGVRLTNAENQAIRQAASKKTFIYSSFFRSNAIQNTPLNALQKQQLHAYFANRSKENYRNLALYIRKNFDRKKIFAPQAKPAQTLPTEMFYYLDREKYFTSSENFIAYLRTKNIYKENAPRIAFCTGSISPLEGNKAYVDSMIIALSHAGYNVFPICSGSSKRLEFLKQVNPQAVVYMPMGRLAKAEGVKWLQKNNVPLFCPFPMLQTHEEWLHNTNGQTGGGLTARIVLAEIDGGICPFAISTENKHGDLYFFDSEPERVKSFVKNVKNYLDLRKKKNQDKRLIIFYFKGPGQTSLHATGLEVAPSLYNLLRRLENEGYTVKNLPADFTTFNQNLQFQGKFHSNSSQGAITKYLQNASPLWITPKEYNSWVNKRIDSQKYQEVVEQYGSFPGSYMNKGDSLAIPYLRFGNIVLMPQPKPAFDKDDFKVTHGVNIPPPHSYIAPYLWAQEEFQADALIHFGTHGNLEFIPGKQTALSHKDWADCLIGCIPHFYYYSIANVGESIIAKRRTHATIISYLTPPFRENKTNEKFKKLFGAIDRYHQATNVQKEQLALKVKKITMTLGLHKDLQLKGNPLKPYSDEEIAYIENFATEITNEKITGKLYSLGKPYAKENLLSTTLAMSTDPLAYSLAKLDLLKGKISQKQYESTSYITKKYLHPLQQFLPKILQSKDAQSSDIYRNWKITEKTIEKAERIHQSYPLQKQKQQNWTPHDKKWADALLEVKTAVENMLYYQDILEKSPELEMQSILNALNGSYIPPSPGGDAVQNPNALPTGRNLYSINAEATPSEKAWETGKMLAEKTLEQYKNKHGKYPQKISYTFWAGEFIASKGTTLAQVLHMLGVAPIYDKRKRVVDLKIIPSKELKRPRIDVVIQVSGQLRDLAASRLFLITKAVALVAESKEEAFPNYVAEGTINIEKILTQKGYSPEQARELSIMRIFGGMNGRYGTGIMDLVEKGDAWSTKDEIAATYLNNMGALYSDEAHWGTFNKDLFATALLQTNIIVQPRQNNTWGALSLDHMYEFMGGMNLSIHETTGKAPETYLADYRNRHRMRLQELKEAIGIESRVTLLNKEYISEKMKGGAGSAETFAKTFRNTYGWNVMKNDAIDNSLWDKLYEVYVKDTYKLGVHAFFETKNPEALQEITAVMLETARKGMWKTSEVKLQQIAELHANLVAKHGVSGSYFTTNKKLQQFIKNKLTDRQISNSYHEQITELSKQNKEAIILKKEDKLSTPPKIKKNFLWAVLAVVTILLLCIGIRARNR